MKKHAKKNNSKTMRKPLIFKAVIGILVVLSAPALVAQVNDNKTVLAANVAPEGGSNPARHNTMTQNNVTSSIHTSDWAKENQYWRDHYASQSYYKAQAPYSMYEPAYQYGMSLYSMNNGCQWEKLDQKTLRADWEREHGNSNLRWDDAQHAAHDAYTRMCNNRTQGIANYSPAGAGR